MPDRSMDMDMSEGFRVLDGRNAEDALEIRRRTLFELEQQRTQLVAPPGLPFAAFEFVSVTFSVPDQDLRVFHHLRSPDPNRIVYIPVMKSHDCAIYDKRTDPEAATWSRNSIVVRSNVAPTTVWLLLAVMAVPAAEGASPRPSTGR